MSRNFVKKLREERLMSKTELARKAGLSPLTIARIEAGKKCRMETKRKIILALGFKLANKDKVFGKDEKKIDTNTEVTPRESGQRRAAGASSSRKVKRGARPLLAGKASSRKKGKS
ncbi:MAG: helix-turn-helix transcriptional regulator [Deltaproteobacteria bacterium]|nr:helix-turn-helix transcriptional regulator [Deltaproteobacteria bacterium]